jgi:hypothetical protein
MAGRVVGWLFPFQRPQPDGAVANADAVTHPREMTGWSAIGQAILKQQRKT